ncbi:Spy/CpxP family protein refolding chaperone [Colwellia sp. BRX10-3]|uniref:Spy/CpxP family protein refolding chaperone n=1 Tax=Colwellia sp. BRX10-3 TaxID=2759844 RepID=UPI0015F63FA3|nr:Spy/CpxP family protein refolding chaperone [Colwellia sp. BRX10-3]MBA6391048.1 Spy/CpxP family protein refolding chaperone [Colwellia sp. BRX10-3]
MKIQKLYSTIKPYAAISLFVLGISSLSANVNAMADKSENHHSYISHENGGGVDKQDKKMKKHLHRLAKKLDLTSEQRSEIKEIFTHMKEDRQAHKAALSGFKEEVKSLLQASQFDENKFNALYIQYQPNFQQAIMEKAKARHGVMQVLTPEQQEKYLSMRKNR